MLLIIVIMTIALLATRLILIRGRQSHWRTCALTHQSKHFQAHWMLLMSTIS